MRILKFIPFLVTVLLASCSGPTDADSGSGNEALVYYQRLRRFLAYEAGARAAEREFGDIGCCSLGGWTATKANRRRSARSRSDLSD